MKTLPSTVVAMALVVAAPALLSASDAVYLDMEKSIRLAEEHSWDVKDSADRLDAAGYRRYQSWGRLLPNATVQLRYSKLSEVEPAVLSLPSASSPPPTTGASSTPQAPPTKEVRLGDTIDEQYSARLVVEQPIFTGGALLSGIRAAKAGQTLAELQTKKARDDLRLQVEEAYAGVLSAEDFLRASDESVELLEELQRIVAQLQDSGRATRLEVREVEARLSQVRSERRGAQAQTRTAQLKLLMLLGLPDDTLLELEENFAADKRVTLPPASELVPQAADSNLDLKIARVAADLPGYEADVAAAALWPKLFGRFSYAYEKPNTRYFPPTFEFQSSWEASVIASWTVWDWGVNWHGWKAAKREEAIGNRSIDRAGENVELQVRSAYENVESAEQRLQSAKLAYEASDDAVALAQELVRLGNLRAADILERQADRARARAGITQALAQRRIALARLSRAVGVESSVFLKEEN